MTDMVRLLRINIVLIIFTVLLMGCNNMKFNNTTNKDDLITITYSIEKIEALRNVTNTKSITFSEFKRDFKVQCIRQTHQGYYVILSLEDGNEAFVFFGEDNMLDSIMIVNRFKTQEEFNIQLLERKYKSEVLNLDSNAILTKLSAVDMTVHIVQEGVCIIKYSRFSDGQVIKDPIITSVEFIENEALITNDDLYIKNEIPFVWEIDKIQ